MTSEPTPPTDHDDSGEDAGDGKSASPTKDDDMREADIANGEKPDE